uniref:HPr family phosphocarrier protein n=1 Tax=uncultured Eubacterium sp. TaxID=165185 RepID=UPI0025FA4B09
MVSKSFTIKNKMGLHMRPANVFVTAMTKYESEIFIQFGGKKINGKSIMNIMAGCIKCGSDIVVECDGPDEEAMMA